MYDLGNTSTIEPQEVREMLASVLSERSELSLAPDDIDRIVDSTFKKVRAVPALQMYGRHGAWVLLRCRSLSLAGLHRRTLLGTE